MSLHTSKSVLFALILLSVSIQLLVACSDSEDKDQEHAKNILRASLKKHMRMTDKDLGNVDQESVDQARAIMPMIDSHLPPEAVPESIFILDKEITNLATNEHLFVFPSYLPSRPTSKGALTFSLGPFPDETTHVIVNIYAREVSEDTVSLVVSRAVDVNPGLKRSFKEILDEDVVRRWIMYPSRSVVLSIVLKDALTGDVFVESEAERLVQHSMVEVKTVAHTRRQRRAAKENARCSEEADSEQECCVKSKVYTAKDLGLLNVISPTHFRLSWCSGQCKLASSFPDLFGSITRKILDNGKIAGEHCCHATEYEHIEILYVNEYKETRSETIFDVVATRCACD